MKNQYFGDVNDYRKYGLLRLLGMAGKARIGVCWMLTANDTRPDGKKTDYLDVVNQKAWRPFDLELYDFLRRRVHGQEADPNSRDVLHFNDKLLPNGHFWTKCFVDDVKKREGYFNSMWCDFLEKKIDLIFFDPDDGLANNNKPKAPLKKGHKNSSKKLFRDEVVESIKKGFSVLLYQHFGRIKRRKFVYRLGRELAGMTDLKSAYSFWTPHLVFFLIPTKTHRDLILPAIEHVRESPWAKEKSCLTSSKNDQRQILVDEHNTSE
jgi:hypothetical protein